MTCFGVRSPGAVATSALPRWSARSPRRAAERAAGQATFTVTVSRGLVLCDRDDLADSFAQILGEARELVAVAYGTETVHDSVATSIDAT